MPPLRLPKLKIENVENSQKNKDSVEAQSNTQTAKESEFTFVKKTHGTGGFNDQVNNIMREFQDKEIPELSDSSASESDCDDEEGEEEDEPTEEQYATMLEGLKATYAAFESLEKEIKEIKRTKD